MPSTRAPQYPELSFPPPETPRITISGGSSGEIRTNVNSPNVEGSVQPEVPDYFESPEYQDWLDSADQSTLDPYGTWVDLSVNMHSQVSSIRSLSELMLYFNSRGPLLESDFSVLIDSPVLAPSSFCLVGINLFDLGVNFSPDSSKLTVQNHSIGTGTVGLSIVVPQQSTGNDVITKLYKRQFNNDGTLAFIPVVNLPKVSICYSTNKVQPFVIFEGCKFSMPIARPNLTGTEKAVFTFNMSYFSYTLT